MWVIYSTHNKHMYENLKVINAKGKCAWNKTISVMNQQFTKQLQEYFKVMGNGNMVFKYNTT